MAKRVGIVSIDLVAGTAQFNTQMSAAKAQIKGVSDAATEANRKMIGENQATAGLIRVVEGGMTNNIRAVENFMSRVLGLGSLMQKIFPVVGAIAFGGLIVSLGEKVYDFFKKSREGADRVENAFRGMLGPIRLANDELMVSNDRLRDEIAKLEGKRQNNLALTLDEARVSSDNLADSLDRNIKQLNEMMKQESVGAWSAFFTRKASTAALDDYLKNFQTETGKVLDKGRETIAGFADKKDDKGQTAAITALNADVTKRYGEAIEYVTTKLKAAREEQAQYDIEQKIREGKTTTLAERELATEQARARRGIAATDQSKFIEDLRTARDLLTADKQRVGLTATESELKKHLGIDQANAANEKLGAPLKDKLDSLNAQVTEARLRLAAAGQSEEFKALIDAQAEAVKAIEEVNKGLDHQKQGLISLKDATGQKILADTEEIAKLAEQAKWQEKFKTDTAELQDRINTQKELTAAIGKGYEATRKAAIEMEVLREVGQKRYNDTDQATQQQVDTVRGLVGTKYDAENETETQRTIKGLQDHIELETRLAAAQSKGADAVHRATLALELERVARDKDIESVAALQDLIRKDDAATRENAAEERLKNLRDEITATRALMVASIEGAEAVRRQQLENEIVKARSQPGGLSSEEEGEMRAKAQLAHQAQITEEVNAAVNADRDRVTVLSQQSVILDHEAAVLRQQKGTEAEQLDIAIKQRETENELLDIEIKRLLKTGSIRDGYKAFFLDMEKEAKKPGEILHDGLMKAVDGVSENLTKLITGQKTNWGEMFKSIGREMVQETIKSGIQKGIAELHKVFDKKKPPAAAKRDGQSRPTAIFVDCGGGNTDDPGDNPANPPAKAPQPSAGHAGGVLGTILKAVGILFGGGGGGGGTSSSSISYDAMAWGGSVTADKSYIVGDDGPEILTRTTGKVMSNAKSRQLVAAGGAPVYNIDARGGDPVLTPLNVKRAIEATHKSSIETGLRANNEQSKRMPR